jgi:hypothetical protein
MHTSIVLWLLVTPALVVLSFLSGMFFCIGTIQTTSITTRTVERWFFWTKEICTTSVAVAVLGRPVNSNFDLRSSSVLDFDKVVDTFSKLTGIKTGQTLLSGVISTVKRLLGTQDGM